MHKAENFRSVLQVAKGGIAMMSEQEKRQSYVLFLSIIVNGLLQMFALVGIVPFVHALIDAEQFLETRVGAEILRFFPGISAQQTLALCGAGLLGLVIVKNAYTWIHIGWRNGFVAKCETRLRSELMTHVLSSSYEWISQQHSNFLRETVFSYPGIWSAQFVRTLLVFANDGVLTIVIFGVLIYVNPVVGAGIAVGAGLLGAMIMKISRQRLSTLVNTKRVSMLAATHICGDAFQGIKDVKMTSSGDIFHDTFLEQSRIASTAEALRGQWNFFPKLSIEVVGFGALLSVSVIAVSQDVDVSELTGVIAIYALAAMRIMPILATLLSNVTEVFNALPVIEIILQIRAVSNESEPVSSETLPRDWKSFCICNTGFKYKNSETHAVRDIDLEIERSKAYGLVGRSGAGKSTLIDIISGLLMPTEGYATLDDGRKPWSSFLGWRQRIGYVSQDPYLLDASLAKNIAFSGPVDTVRIQRAVSIAQLTDVVNALPDGLETRVGEQGVMLSGGQRQRVAIARAIYREPDILILDEATSSLDSLSEQEFNAEVKALAGKITLIIIAHRLATVRDCDEIWVMRDGEMISKGTHKNLAEESLEYQSLLQAQNLEGPRSSTAFGI